MREPCMQAHVGHPTPPGVSRTRRLASLLMFVVALGLAAPPVRALVDPAWNTPAMPRAVDWDTILFGANNEQKLSEEALIGIFIAWSLGNALQWTPDPEPKPQPAARAADANGGDLEQPPALASFSFSGNCAPQRVVAVHPSQRLIFFATSAGSQGTVCAYRLDPVARTLVPAAGSPFATGGAPADAIAVDPSGVFLFSVASDDSSVVAFRVDSTTGVLTRVSQVPVATPPNPLAIAVDPGGRFVYVATRANRTSASTIAAYALDAATGGLTPLPGSPYPAPDSAFALAMDPLGRFVYLTAGNALHVYAVDAATGALSAAGTAVPGSGRIAVDPAGRAVYVEGSEFIAPDLIEGVRTYAVGTQGALTAVGGLVAVGANVIDIAVARSGRQVHVVSSQEKADFSGFAYSLTTLKRDEAGGGLSPIPAAPLSIPATRALAAANVLPSQAGWITGEPLFYPLGAYGGQAPYAWAVAGGSLPPGLSVDGKLGALRGTPTLAGAYDFVVQVTDARGAAATKDYHFTVAGAASNMPVPVVEYYHAGLDHYFVTWVPDEIAKLDAGTVIRGWSRTNETFPTLVNPRPGTSAVCRYYIPPELGNSHFYGRGVTECTDTGRGHPSFILESADFMQMFLPVDGNCPTGTTPVYRVFSDRPDANHRYMTSKAIRDQMIGKGWRAEGDGPDLVAMCAPGS